MSGQFTSIVMFASLVAIAFATNHATDDSILPKGPRGPASISKEIKLFKPVAEMVKHTEKLHGPLHVKVEVMGAAPAAAGDIFVLRGTITAQQNIDVADFSWSIPKGVEVVNGEVAGSLKNVSPDYPGTVEITLR